MQNQILEDLKTAMKCQDKEKLLVIRMLKSEVQMEKLNKKRDLTDEEVIAIVAKQIKTRKESIKEFEKGNRQDLIEQTQNEIEVLTKYLPEQLTAEKVEKIIEDAFLKIKPQSVKDMGKIMGIITPQVRGRYDMSEVSKLVKNKLNPL